MEVGKDNGVELKEINKKRQNQMDKFLDENPKANSGDLVKGTVEKIGDGKVTVFISGTKREIDVPLESFEQTPELKSIVEGRLRIDPKGKHQLILQKKINEESVKDFKEAQENKTPVVGEFVSVVETKIRRQDEGSSENQTSDDSAEKTKISGYVVKLSNEYSGFCPLSKADVEHINDPNSLIGVKDYFIIEKFNPNPRYKSIVNRREYLEGQINAIKKEFFENIAIGDVVEGTVKSITNFGAFVNLGGFDGLLHLSDMSWGHVTKAKNFVKKGDVLRLRVISFDLEKHKINLSLKDMETNPWDTFAERYTVGQVIKGSIVRVTNYGVFVEIEPGIEGLCHISELSWTKKNFNPAEIYHVKDVVEAKILGYDLAKRRISLTIKELIENPWNTIVEKFPVGTKLTAPAVKVTESAAFFKLVDEIDGFLSIDDISWSEKYKNMHEFVKEGEEKEVIITQVDSKNQRIRLSIKALSENPWELFAQSHPKNSAVKATITSVSEVGVNVKVGDFATSFINKANMIIDETASLPEVYKVGQEIDVIIMDVNVKSQKVVLSMKEFEKRQSLGDYQKYMSDQSNESEGFTLGDVLAKSDN